MRITVEMQQIRYFLKLAETLNFTRAAEASNVTQPALTRAIRALELELGGDLIRREARNSHLTELGRRMLPLLQQCYEAANSAKSLARAVHSSEVAPLAFGVMRGIGMARLMGPMGELFRAFPGAQLSIRRGSADEILALLKEGAVDLAVSAKLDGAWERLDCWQLFADPFGLVVHGDHRLSRRNAVAPGDLAGEQMLCLRGCEMRIEVEAWLGQAGAAVSQAHEAESDDDVLALLAANAGIAMLPGSLELPSSILRLQVAGFDLARAVALHAVAGRQRAPVAAALITLLRAADWPEPP